MTASITHACLRPATALANDTPLQEALRALLADTLPALPVLDADGRLLGIFGEREFIAALFPGYIGTLGSAAFVPSTLDGFIERRLDCVRQPVSKYANTEHVDAASSVSDVQLAETFLHHRVLLVPIVEDGQILGVVTRGDFFRVLADKLLTAAA